ncbi:F0F1 ATP synthase subunit A [Pectinatus haikarae]|uniref:ATP synthase subunit a n=1 Tax=Pectinatus haikarae TaxID=349096 RepID=A0ABT9Y676_9FIRM|nr:F0F1 ATP synthase subunit A [Pectinatus haikarae]MDQ0203056.1 F-type H+-transporting ATPase subunit a [Pectinatus haikarae]
MPESAAHELMLFGLSFNMETLKMTWMVMAVVVIMSIVATRNMKLVPVGLQNIFELIITSLNSQINANLGKRGVLFAPFLISLFLFLLISNWWGLIPGMASPTNTLNTNLGLALLVVVMLHVLGLYYKGTKYIKHFFEPFAPFVIIKLIEEIAKPITLSFRLFGNIVAGELLIHILPKLLPNIFAEVIPGVIWLAFSTFVGIVQAFVFTMLSMSYLADGVNDEEDA